MLRQRIAPGWLLGLALCTLGGMAFAATPKPPVAPQPVATNVPAEMHVAILGEIQRPGVYRIVGQSLTLQQLVTRAQGFTPAASTLIRPIRCGKPSDLFPFRPDGRDEIRDGDVYQVERDPRLPVGRNSRGIHVALVGILNRPVVQEIPALKLAETTLLIHQLGLPTEAARQVHVIDDHRKMRWDPGQGPVEPLTLENGAVVVFEPGLFAGRKAPPGLAAAFEYDRSQKARASSTATAEPCEAAPGLAVVESELPPLPAPLPAAIPAPAEVVSADLKTPGESEALREFPPAPVPAPRSPVPPTGQPLALDPMEDLADAFGEEELDAPEEAASSISVWHLFGILGAVVGLVGMALAVRQAVGGGRIVDEFEPAREHSLQPTEAAASTIVPAQEVLPPVVAVAVAAAVPPVVPERDELATRLQQLLDDAVPIREEPIDLPTELRLDGWLSAAAVVHRHTEHAPIPRPHVFGGRMRRERRAGRVEQFLEEAARPAAKPRDVEPSAEDNAVVARALILERLKQATDLRTPFDRALQQLQGGGR